jgi:pre-60S factor REI1
VAKAKRLETWIEHHRDEIEAARAAMEARESSRRAEEDETEDDEAYDDFDEGDDDEASEDGWESMDEDEAREVLARMDRMAASGPRGESDSDDDGSESDDASGGEGMELDLTNAPVRLAENGYELIITRDDGTKRRIGPRELRRYYKQRHRPEDDRAAVLANRASTTERGLARLGETRAGERGVQKFDTAGKFVGLQISIMVKRAQKAARKYERNNMFQGNSSIKKFDLNGQNVKIKLPKACPY